MDDLAAVTDQEACCEADELSVCVGRADPEVVHSVFMEEMLHLTMAANILNAVGGSPKIDTPNLLPKFPTYLPHSNRAFEVPLMK